MVFSYCKYFNISVNILHIVQVLTNINHFHCRSTDEIVIVVLGFTYKLVL